MSIGTKLGIKAQSRHLKRKSEGLTRFHIISSHLSMLYSKKHPTMADPARRSCDPLEDNTFGKSGGITNGAKWYSVRGGMQDFNYLSSNDFEVTLELGCKKYPAAAELEGEWNRNKDALINFMWGVSVFQYIKFEIELLPIQNYNLCFGRPILASRVLFGML
jgi:hypothetical protein